MQNTINLPGYILRSQALLLKHSQKTKNQTKNQGKKGLYNLIPKNSKYKLLLFKISKNKQSKLVYERSYKDNFNQPKIYRDNDYIFLKSSDMSHTLKIKKELSDLHTQDKKMIRFECETANSQRHTFNYFLVLELDNLKNQKIRNFEEVFKERRKINSEKVLLLFSAFLIFIPIIFTIILFLI